MDLSNHKEIFIILTADCNNKCSYCHIGKDYLGDCSYRLHGPMKPDVYREVHDAIKEYSIRERKIMNIIYNGGEVLCHKDLLVQSINEFVELFESDAYNRDWYIQFFTSGGELNLAEFSVFLDEITRGRDTKHFIFVFAYDGVNTKIKNKGKDALERTKLTKSLGYPTKLIYVIHKYNCENIIESIEEAYDYGIINNLVLKEDITEEDQDLLNDYILIGLNHVINKTKELFPIYGYSIWPFRIYQKYFESFKEPQVKICRPDQIIISPEGYCYGCSALTMFRHEYADELYRVNGVKIRKYEDLLHINHKELYVEGFDGQKEVERVLKESLEVGFTGFMGICPFTKHYVRNKMDIYQLLENSLYNHFPEITVELERKYMILANRDALAWQGGG